MQKLPLEGIRVMEFCVMFAGPHLGQWLAVMGAEVIRVESVRRLDQHRNQVHPPNGGGSFVMVNYGKKSINLNMTQPKALELARKLVKISDVVIDNFGGPVMERWGLGYSELKKVKPGIIAFTGSGFGRNGPYRERPAFAQIIGAFDGSTMANGYPGGEPMTIGTAGWTDSINAIHGAFAIQAALYHRSQTGEGQFIDGAMVEATINFLAEGQMDFFINGRVGERVGNRDNIMAPHGCYRCQGEDKWVAIAVSNDKEWKAFCKAIDNPTWTKKEEFSDELSRWKNQDELDRLVEEWTRKHDYFEAMNILQAAGVMAGASFSAKEALDDVHLKERAFFVKTGHAEIGELPFAGLPWRLSDSPKGNYRNAPMLGEHNDYVFGELLGLSKEEIVQLKEEKVIY